MKAKIHKNALFGKNCIIEDNCEIGRPPRGRKEGELSTTIGDNAVMRSNTVIYAGTKIGNNFQTGHSVIIRENNTIGHNVSIGSNSTIEVDNKIGNNVRIHSLCFLEKTCIEDTVFIGPCVLFTDDPHPQIPTIRDCMKGATVKKNAKIGGGVTLLPYVTIGENALIGAGSVVTKDVPANMVVAGNPAHKLKNISEMICDKNKNDIHKPYI